MIIETVAQVIGIILGVWGYYILGILFWKTKGFKLFYVWDFVYEKAFPSTANSEEEKVEGLWKFLFILLWVLILPFSLLFILILSIIWLFRIAFVDPFKELKI